MDYHRALGTSVNTVSKQHTQSNMNKRIYELAVETGIIKEEEGYYWIQSVDTLEKFAELIVQDCIGCCDIVGKIEWPETPTYDLAIDGCKLKIKQHFGIEEGGEEEVFSCPTCGLQNPTTTCGLPNCGLIHGVEE